MLNKIWIRDEVNADGHYTRADKIPEHGSTKDTFLLVSSPQMCGLLLLLHVLYDNIIKRYLQEKCNLKTKLKIQLKNLIHY